jgi:hypothetical protein
MRSAFVRKLSLTAAGLLLAIGLAHAASATPAAGQGPAGAQHKGFRQAGLGLLAVAERIALHTWVFPPEEAGGVLSVNLIGHGPAYNGIAQLDVAAEGKVLYGLCADLLHVAEGDRLYIAVAEPVPWQIRWLMQQVQLSPSTDRVTLAAIQAAVWFYTNGVLVDPEDPTVDGPEVDELFLLIYHELLDFVPEEEPALLCAGTFWDDLELPDEKQRLVTCEEAPSGCTRTVGYWKTHPEAWPVESLVLGDEDYTKDEALQILRRSSRGDASVILARQLIAAKLNFASGADGSAIAETIEAADAWLSQYQGKLPYSVPPSRLQQRRPAGRPRALRLRRAHALALTAGPIQERRVRPGAGAARGCPLIVDLHIKGRHGMSELPMPALLLYSFCRRSFPPFIVPFLETQTIVDTIAREPACLLAGRTALPTWRRDFHPLPEAGRLLGPCARSAQVPKSGEPRHRPRPGRVLNAATDERATSSPKARAPYVLAADPCRPAGGDRDAAALANPSSSYQGAIHQPP